jgi:hypothetical protein
MWAVGCKLPTQKADMHCSASVVPSLEQISGWLKQVFPTQALGFETQPVDYKRCRADRLNAHLGTGHWLTQFYECTP